MVREEIIDYMEVCNKNFWSLQNNWMAEVYAPHDAHTEDDWCGATLELG